MSIQGLHAFTLAVAVLAAQEPGNLFDELYSARVKAVIASRDKADDLALAGEILEAAKTLSESPAAQAVFADKAYELAANLPEGTEIAVAAAKLLATADPKRAAVGRERVAMVLRKALNRGTPDERKKAGQLLIHESVSAAESVEESDPTEAAALYRQALTVALQIKDPDVASIRTAMDRVSARVTAMSRISQLQEKLLENANDKVTAKALAELMIAELDTPAAAVQPASLSGDPALIANVASAQLGSLEWSETQAHSLAQWYHELAGKASAGGRAKMLRKSATAYQRFLAMHADNDAARLKATLILKEIEKEVGATGPTLTATTSPIPQPTQPKEPAKEDDKEKPANIVLPLLVKDFVIEQDIQFDSTKGVYTIEGTAKVKDGHHSKRLYIDVGPGVQIKGGTIHLSTRGHLRIKGEPDKPVVLRDMTIIQDLSGSFTAEHAIFENVTFRKGGVWWATYSSKWTFTKCLLHACKFPKLTKVDYAFKFRNCSFTFMSFPETQGPFKHDWRVIENCNFIGCTVPPTVGWCTERCNFYGCEFPAGEKYKETGLTMEPYLFKTKGPPPQTSWQSEPNAGTVTVKPALKPYDVFKFPVKVNIPELRADRTIADVLFE